MELMTPEACRETQKHHSYRTLSVAHSGAAPGEPNISPVISTCIKWFMRFHTALSKMLQCSNTEQELAPVV